MIRALLALAASLTLASWAPSPQTLTADCTGVGQWDGALGVTM